MMERVSSWGLGQSLLRSAMAVQARLAEKQGENASGLKGESYADLSADSARLISMESDLSRLRTRADNTRTALDRVEAMHSALGSMVDLAGDLRSTLSGLLSSTDGTVDYASVGQGLLDDLAGLMNLQVDGRYLFGGGRTTSAPVDVSLLSVPATPSTADAAYYLGDGAVQSVTVSDQSTIGYGVTAGESGFEKILRAANILAHIDSSNPDDDAVSGAYDLATEALDGLLAAQGRLSVDAGRLEASQERQDTAITLLGDRISDAKSVDVAAVTVQISQLQTILEASYSALSKISSLSLTKF
jgi:flagellar hook-associated protein 3 FlgL